MSLKGERILIQIRTVSQHTSVEVSQERFDDLIDRAVDQGGKGKKHCGLHQFRHRKTVCKWRKCKHPVKITLWDSIDQIAKLITAHSYSQTV